MSEFCKRHRVDHTGTFCGGCFVLFKRKAKQLDKITREMNKERSMTKARFKELKKIREHKGRESYGLQDL